MSKRGEGKSKHLRWTKPMEKVMLETLADEVKNGSRPNNSFRMSSFTRVANSINQQFGVECSADHVEHHLRTVKSAWSTIEQLRNKTGLGWDDNMKMIMASPRVYNDHVQAHPSHEKFLNKRIEMYDEMAIVVGKDKARGDFSKSFADINLAAEIQLEPMLEDNASNEETSKDSDLAKQTSSSGTSKSSKHGKRSRASYDAEQLDAISTSIRDVAIELGKMNKSMDMNQLVVAELYDEVMKMEGFDEAFLALACDYLAQNEMLGKTFMAKNYKLRKLWLENFQKQG